MFSERHGPNLNCWIVYIHDKTMVEDKQYSCLKEQLTKIMPRDGYKVLLGKLLINLRNR